MGRAEPTSSDGTQKRFLEMVFFVVSAVLIVTVTLNFLIKKHISEDIFCLENSMQYMVKINGTVDFESGRLTSSDGMLYSPGQFWTADDEEKTIWGCPCLAKPCINKCCPSGKGYYRITLEYGGFLFPGLSACKEKSHPFNIRRSVYSRENFTQEVDVKDDHFYIKPGAIPCLETYELPEQENDNASLLEDGRLYIKGSTQPFRGIDEYCLESINGTSEPVPIMCYPTATEPETNSQGGWADTLKMVGFLTSLPCLLATLLTYLVLPQLRNLHGKATICHVASLTISFSGLATTFFVGEIPKTFCIILGYIILFSTLASFFWLNVMGFDIWWVFSGGMSLPGGQKFLEQLKFRLYSLYAWGCPLVVTAVALVVDYCPAIPHSDLRPDIGIYSCFIEGRDPRLLYLYLPIGLVVYLNTAMFLTTSLRFKKHSRCVKRLQRGDSRRHCRAGKSLTDVERFSLYVKLSVVMGINWILEVADFLCACPHPLWILSDLVNALQGVFILYIFVCKPRILAMLNERLCPSLQLFSTERSTRALTLTSSVKSTSSSASRQRKGSDAESQLTSIHE